MYSNYCTTFIPFLPASPSASHIPGDFFADFIVRVPRGATWWKAQKISLHMLQHDETYACAICIQVSMFSL